MSFVVVYKFPQFYKLHTNPKKIQPKLINVKSLNFEAS